MSPEFVLNVVTGLGPALVAILTWFQSNSDRSIRRRSRALDDLEFISSFLAFAPETRSHLVVEQAFAAHLKHHFDFDEVIAVLNLQNPKNAFRLLRNSREVVELDALGRFWFRSNFATEKKRSRRLWMWFLLYFLALYAAVMPLMFVYDAVKASGLGELAPVIFWLLPTLFFAYHALMKGRAISMGIKLVAEKLKST